METIKAIYSKNSNELTKKMQDVFTLVRGVGDENADFVVVLSNPSEAEETTGLKVDTSLRNKIEQVIKRIYHSVDSVYFTYSVKSCPYEITKRGKIKYRKVNSKDIELFSDFLKQEVKCVNPKVVFLVGNAPYKSFIGKNTRKNFEIIEKINDSITVVAFKEESDLEKNIDDIVDRLKVLYPVDIKEDEPKSLSKDKSEKDNKKDDDKSKPKDEKNLKEEVKEEVKKNSDKGLKQQPKENLKEDLKQSQSVNKHKKPIKKQSSQILKKDEKPEKSTDLYEDDNKSKEDISNKSNDEKQGLKSQKKEKNAFMSVVSKLKYVGRKKTKSYENDDEQEVSDKSNDLTEPKVERRGKLDKTEKSIKIINEKSDRKNKKLEKLQADIENTDEDIEVKAWDEFDKASYDRSKHRNVVVLYAGSNLKNEATKPILSTVADVFSDLTMNVIMLNVYDNEFSADLFLDKLADCAGFVIGTSVDWYGTGTKVQQLFDDMYYSGRVDELKDIPVMAITISRAGYEEEGNYFIKNSLEVLGASVVSTLTGVIESGVYYDTNKTYKKIVETKAEDFYRTMKKGARKLPTSINARKVFLKVTSSSPAKIANDKNVDNNKNNDKISSYNEFLEAQKRDIDELSEIFKEKMSVTSKGKSYRDIFVKSFKKGVDIDKSIICFDIEDEKSENFNIEVDKNSIKHLPFNNIDCDVIISLAGKNMNNILNKKVTMQKSFLTGEIKVKGNFALLYKMDKMFRF